MEMRAAENYVELKQGFVGLYLIKPFGRLVLCSCYSNSFIRMDHRHSNSTIKLALGLKWYPYQRLHLLLERGNLAI